MCHGLNTLPKTWVGLMEYIPIILSFQNVDLHGHYMISGFPFASATEYHNFIGQFDQFHMDKARAFSQGLTCSFVLTYTIFMSLLCL